MMQTQTGSGAPFSPSRLILEPNYNDVLLGKGPASYEFVGNHRFRELAQQRQEEYVSAKRTSEKQKIAKELFNQVKGRFLEKVDGQEAWIEADCSVALDKCKQILRQRFKIKKKKDSDDNSLGRENAKNNTDQNEKDSSKLMNPQPPTLSQNDVSPLNIQSSTREEQQVVLGAENDCQEKDGLAYVAQNVDLLQYLVSQNPKLTTEDHERERVEMREEENVEALKDVLRTSFALERGPSKRQKQQDMDELPVQFLVEQMRLAIELIPLENKQALAEALEKSHPEEFTDARLQLFLRLEDMRPPLGAQRFVNYWETRREVFGSERYFMRMRLSEGALRDKDLVALETGTLSLLPRLDGYGRQIVFCMNSRNTKEGYTTDNMLRACWYIAEVEAWQEMTGICSGFVWIAWKKDITVWNLDTKFISQKAKWIKDKVLPCKPFAFHTCCPPSFLVKYIRPLLNALAGKGWQSRRIVHNGSESQVLESLSVYGITKDMLPTELGGVIKLDPHLWIARRRAIELRTA